MWRYYQANPSGLNVGDCTIRAICAVTGLDWHTVHRALCDLSAEMADMPSANRVFAEYMRILGFGKQRLIDQCPNCYTVSDFASDHPSGIYILGPHEHVVALINGDWYDSWDSGDTIPLYYFKRRQ